MEKYTTVLIIDYGSQYTQLIARRVREAGVYSAILPCTATDEEIKDARPTAIILSGSPDSVLDKDAPTLSPVVLDLKVPVLGICYGMQLLAHKLGGELVSATNREYGPAKLTTKESPLWQDIKEKSFTVWMSHGDKVHKLPQGFKNIASTENLEVAAMANEDKNIYAVQFHPEVYHTQNGSEIIQNFLYKISGLEKSWSMTAFIERSLDECRAQVGDSNVVLGLSGGIDSTVVAALLHKAIGKQLHCIYVDQGLMRKNETKQVAEMLNKHLPGLNLNLVDASDIFLDRLKGIEDPEEKRKIIGHSFIEVFDKEAHKISNVKFLAQGTVYPDIIESFSARGEVIKSHHNVGGLPETMKMDLVEPLKELFKDEVRAVGEELGLPEEVVWRHPFPGPGLAIRVLGEVTRDRVALLQDADAIVRDELTKNDWYRKVWQAFAVLLPLKTVGVMGDARTYDNVVALRVVDSVDAMTADWSRLPYEIMAKISSRIISEVPGINRVVYDISSKPPSTIEWE